MSASVRLPIRAARWDTPSGPKVVMRPPRRLSMYCSSMSRYRYTYRSPPLNASLRRSMSPFPWRRVRIVLTVVYATAFPPRRRSRRTSRVVASPCRARTAMTSRSRGPSMRRDRGGARPWSRRTYYGCRTRRRRRSSGGGTAAPRPRRLREGETGRPARPAKAHEDAAECVGAMNRAVDVLVIGAGPGGGFAAGAAARRGGGGEGIACGRRGRKGDAPAGGGGGVERGGLGGWELPPSREFVAHELL